MSHPDYKDIGDIEDRVIEELSELIHAICKAKRFGYFKNNPLIENSPTNIENISSEISDVNDRLSEYIQYMKLICVKKSEE